MKIVFFGTPDFAVPSLQKLIDSDDAEVSLVVSQPDRKRSRNKMTPTPVKELALKYDIPVITPEKLNDKKVLERIISENADFLVVIAYGQIIKEKLLKAYKDRIINIHGSILPEYRGAAPMQRSILDGNSITGVSSMLIDSGMDTGDILDIREENILDEDTLETMELKLSNLGADLLLDTLRNFDDRYKNRIKQDAIKATYAAKIEKEEAKLNFDESSKSVFDKIRTLNIWPGAKISINGEIFKLHKSHIEKRNDEFKNGVIWKADKSGIYINACDGTIVVTEIQASNHKKMNVEDYLRGNRFETPIEVDR